MMKRTNGPVLFDLSTISGRWRLSRDPAYREWPRDEWPDAWTIEGRPSRGWRITSNIYPYSKTLLAVATEKAREYSRSRGRLEELCPGELRRLTPSVLLFPARPEPVDAVCHIIKAKKRRQVSPETHRRLAEMSRRKATSRGQERTSEAGPIETTSEEPAVEKARKDEVLS